MSRISNSSPSKALLVAFISLALSPQFAGAKETTKSTPSTSTPESFEPPLANEIVVSDRDFNHFVFPAAIVNGPIFPAGSPILGKPVYLSDNTQLLLQLVQGSDKPFNMIVELENGAVYKFWLRPRPIAGITRRVDGANEKRSAHRGDGSQGVVSPPARGADIELLKAVVAGAIPEGFESIELPAPTRFDKFSVIPLSGWSDGDSRRILMFSLVAVPGQTAVVAPPQFYRPGITAVSLDGDVVDQTSSPTLYMIEEIKSDE